MQQNVITYNLNTVEILLDKYSLEPLAMYYLLKVVFVNSIIYSTDIHEIFVYLKSIKAIPRNYKYSDFQEAINNLIESEYLFINEYNHFQISNIKKRSWIL